LTRGPNLIGCSHALDAGVAAAQAATRGGRLPNPRIETRIEGDHRIMKLQLTTVAAFAALAFAPVAASAGILDNVKQRGSLNCGANTGLAGFGMPDQQGNWTGLDVDFCRAVAAAIFNDPTKVKFVPLSAKDRFTALQSGEVDVLSRNGTVTLSRDTTLGLNWGPPNYYDGQGFMVRKKLNIASAKELNGASICVQQGTTTELNLADYFRANNMKYEGVVFATSDETDKAYDAGRCDAFTTDASGLYSERLKFANPDEHIVLPEIISKEPLAAAVRHGDDQWFDIVKWTHYAMLNAEELGVTQKNVDEHDEIGQSRDQAPARNRGQVRRGARPDQRLGLSHHQACRQLRRELRAQCRRGLASEDQARPQRAVDEGRPAIRLADPLIDDRAGACARRPDSF
jgi:general L-amino acid transport system substrate-binding protein